MKKQGIQYLVCPPISIAALLAMVVINSINEYRRFRNMIYITFSKHKNYVSHRILYCILKRTVKYVDRNMIYWSVIFEQNNDDQNNKKITDKFIFK